MESSSSKRSSPSEPSRSRKRAKYTQLACNECKRRKLKCDGQPVCARCTRQNATCVYTPSSHASSNTPVTPSCETKDDGLSTKFRTVDQQIEALHREMRVMSARMRELESASATPSASNNGGASISSSSVSAGLRRIMNRPGSPDYVGPTSAEFGLAARQKNTDGGDGNESDGEDLEESTSATSPAAVSDVEAMSNDPLGWLGKDEALRLVTVYENNVGLMYPCIDLDSLRCYVNDYYKDGPIPPGTTDQDWFFARDAEVLKILLATALLAESHGWSERAALLADSVEDRFATRVKIPEVDMKELLILTLLSIFHSYRDDEVISWRIIGMAVRGSIQLGLHRQETWLRTGGVFPGEVQWTFASRLFWCIYVLDRKWSFGTGLPFAIQDSDMDTNLPEPGAATPYLTCMINYARLSTKIWGLVMGWRSRPKAATSDYCSYLDFQVQQWIQSIPRELRFDPDPAVSETQGLDSDSAERMTMLQVLLALQANQLRILVYRQNLLSSDSIESNAPGALTAVETAKSTVHMLDYFSRVSDIYFQRPEPFNYFLISALAALFLAVLHAPARFSGVCRQEFYAAVDMVRRSSTRAHTSRRLQKIIKSLKMIRLGIDGRAVEPGRRRKRQDLQQQQQTPAQDPGSDFYPQTSGTSPTPLSHAMSSPSHGHGHGQPHTHQRNTHSISNPNTPSTLLTPHPQLQNINHLWSNTPSLTPHTNHHTSTHQQNWLDESTNSCEDLTSFFEMAGGLYFDADPSLTTNAHANTNTNTNLSGKIDGDTNPSSASGPGPGSAFVMGSGTANGDVQGSMGVSVTDALGAFEAEDEALTRVMAGLL
ncbi:transcription factor domain-containing protein [Aspergillus stella-maris]|uniref:transcription factor domain-containing protein n=1 Tax=Aspergillus stella-maris TaxID=1810926 RepID=UPI003CCE4DF8